MLPLLIPLLGGTAAMAQTASPEVISSAGAAHANANAGISYTIGQPVYETVSGGSTLTQGFQQPWADVSTEMGPSIAATPGINVYPNPTRHIMHVVYPTATQGQRLELRDADGRLVLSDRIQHQDTELDLGAFATGLYTLRLLDAAERTVNIFKITINQ